MTWIGLDDTDSVAGMCTTFLAAEVPRRSGWALLALPRLVRLNPNIPWKTRGNGALALRLGRGRGPSIVIGELAGKEMIAFQRGRPAPPKEALRTVAAVVEDLAELDAPGTNPGVFAAERRPRERLYREAVKDIVPLRTARQRARGGLWRTWGDGRGLIGAVAAGGWRRRDGTYEVIAYGERARWGTPRDIDAEGVRRLDRRFPETFNNYDPEAGRPVIAPRSPCPILFGIRGDRPERLPEAMRSLGGERPAGWLTFLTNQGTDDHLIRRPRGLRRGTSVVLDGTVASPPRWTVGGHVVFALKGNLSAECVAYEPSKGFRHAVAALAEGDRVSVCGAVRDRPLTVNLEKLRVRRTAPVRLKVANPVCACGDRMKSAGRGEGYRCPGCGSAAPPEAAA